MTSAACDCRCESFSDFSEAAVRHIILRKFILFIFSCLDIVYCFIFVFCFSLTFFYLYYFSLTFCLSISFSYLFPERISDTSHHASSFSNVCLLLIVPAVPALCRRADDPRTPSPSVKHCAPLRAVRCSVPNPWLTAPAADVFVQSLKDPVQDNTAD